LSDKALFRILGENIFQSIRFAGADTSKHHIHIGAVQSLVLVNTASLAT